VLKWQLGELAVSLLNKISLVLIEVSQCHNLENSKLRQKEVSKFFV
jgi:hypothetical protein